MLTTTIIDTMKTAVTFVDSSHSEGNVNFSVTIDKIMFIFHKNLFADMLNDPANETLVKRTSLSKNIN